MRPSRTDSSASHISGTGADSFVTHADDFGGTVSKDQKLASTKVKSVDQQRYYGTHVAPTRVKGGTNLTFVFRELEG
jgi:hypothetical protein